MNKEGGIYLRLRRLVDYDLVENYRPISPILGLVPIGGMVVADTAVSGLAAAFGWLVATSVGAVWTGFVLWRVARLSKAAAMRGDRGYDQRTKFALPPEYEATESATAAAQRRRSKR